MNTSKPVDTPDASADHDARSLPAEFLALEPVIRATLGSGPLEARRAALEVLSQIDARNSDIGTELGESHIDLVVSLLDEPDEGLLGDLLEYLEDRARPGDAPRLLAILESRKHLFSVTQALEHIFPGGPILDEHDAAEDVTQGIATWRNLLSKL